MNNFNMPRIPVGESIEFLLDIIVEHAGATTRVCSAAIENCIDMVEYTLMFIHPIILVQIFAFLAWRTSGKILPPILTVLGFGLIYNFELWSAAMSTLSLIFVAISLSIIIGIPLGILLGISNKVQKITAPVLDVMQTMPSFVYLIPVIPLFGLGKVAAVFATLIFALPPVIRMTSIGIRQVPSNLVECANSFGASRLQRLWKIEIPLATPSIFAGINQAVMMALSMVVVAAMIGARGLGGEVWKAIQRLNMGLGFEAGMSIVILAIFMDRVLQGIGNKFSQHTQ